MEKELQKLYEQFDFRFESERETLQSWIEVAGLDKSLETIDVFRKLTGIKDKLDSEYVSNFVGYDFDLSETLFTLLRIEEEHIKAFLCNKFHGEKIEIEARPSKTSKLKYYYLFPVGNGKTLDIRTNQRSEKYVSYYEAMKSVDFGSINQIMASLPKSILKEFSNNDLIIEDLDYTRKMRNYVYHHNMLFSIDKDILKEAIIKVLANLPHKSLKEFYIAKIEALRFAGSNRVYDIGEKIAISFSNEDKAKIHSIKPMLD